MEFIEDDGTEDGRESEGKDIGVSKVGNSDKEGSVFPSDRGLCDGLREGKGSKDDWKGGIAEDSSSTGEEEEGD